MEAGSRCSQIHRRAVYASIQVGSGINAMTESAWCGSTTTPMEMVVQSGDGVLTVAIKVPWFLEINAIQALNIKLHELFHAVDQMDGRAPSEFPVVQSRVPQDWEQDWVSWSREYSDPDYAAQFTHALEAMAARGIPRWIH